MGRIIAIICIVFLLVGCFWWWHNSHPPNLYDQSARRDAMETGATTMEDGRTSGEAHPSPSRSDAPGTINGDPYHPVSDETADRTQMLDHPSARDAVGRGTDSRTEYRRPDRLGRHPEGPVYAQPARDTQPSENPDGERFGGGGGYQWYRQGDLTYRINTRTGQSCIIYATMNEWRKAFVYRHGCRA